MRWGSSAPPSQGIRGGSGDEILGVGGADELRGNSGADEMFAGNGDDTVLGGTGNDGIDVSGDQANGFQDEVFCGPGEDAIIRRRARQGVWSPQAMPLKVNPKRPVTAGSHTPPARLLIEQRKDALH